MLSLMDKWKKKRNELHARAQLFYHENGTLMIYVYHFQYINLCGYAIIIIIIAFDFEFI